MDDKAELQEKLFELRDRCTAKALDGEVDTGTLADFEKLLLKLHRYFPISPRTTYHELADFLDSIIRGF